MNISKNIEAAFFKLGARNVHHERKKENDTCGAVGMTTVLPLVLSKLELNVIVFVLTKYHPLPAI